MKNNTQNQDMKKIGNTDFSTTEVTVRKFRTVQKEGDSREYATINY